MLDLKKLNRSAEEAERKREAEKAAQDRTFRRKVAIQQFMNHNGPLFRAFAKAGTPLSEVTEGDVLREPVEQANRLAMLVAAKIAGKPADEVTAAEAKPFRSEAAELVAARWLQKKPLDVEREAAEIAAAAGMADHSWDHDSFRDERISDDASLMITAASVAGSLARQVEIYDFRMGKGRVLQAIVAEVVREASRRAAEMLAPEAGSGDVRNLTQTLARNLCSLMEACYERKAREVVTKLNGRPEKEKASWLATSDPLSDVLESFREWALCFNGFALAACRGLSPEPQKEEPVRLEKA